MPIAEKYVPIRESVVLRGSQLAYTCLRKNQMILDDSLGTWPTILPSLKTATAHLSWTLLDS